MYRFLQPGVNVLITIFTNFRRHTFFFKANIMIQFLQKLAVFWTKKRQVSQSQFWEHYSKPWRSRLLPTSQQNSKNKQLTTIAIQSPTVHSKIKGLAALHIQIQKTYYEIEDVFRLEVDNYLRKLLLKVVRRILYFSVTNVELSRPIHMLRLILLQDEVAF
jgi:hypothetical protein